MLDNSDANCSVIVGMIIASIAYGCMTSITEGFLAWGIGLIAFAVISQCWYKG